MLCVCRYAQAGVASCGHVETIAHGNYHDQAGQNGQGRAPDSGAH